MKNKATEQCVDCGEIQGIGNYEECPHMSETKESKVKPQHTPEYFLDGQYLCEQDAQSGMVVADIRADDDVRQMIVRAVNAHEELVRVLKLVQSGRHCMADINEAIAKAERK